jgi:chromate transporter
MIGMSEQMQPIAPVSLGALFAAFLAVSLVGFGGGIAWAHRIAVERRRWLSEHDFADVVSLCQFLPGPNIVGIAVCVGAKTRGGPGALAAMGGFLLIPLLVGFTAGVLYLQHAHHPLLQNILAGVSATAAGLLIATGLRLLRPHRRRVTALLFVVLAFGLMAFSRLPLLAILFTLTPLSIAVTAAQTARVR